MPATRQTTARFASRTVHGIDDAGTRETILLWIEWQHGGQWAVGRMVNPHLRENPNQARSDDYVFTGFEMQDALDAANDALESDLDVSYEDGAEEEVAPFEEEELRVKLERWFFDHR